MSNTEVTLDPTEVIASFRGPNPPFVKVVLHLPSVHFDSIFWGPLSLMLLAVSVKLIYSTFTDMVRAYLDNRDEKRAKKEH